MAQKFFKRKQAALKHLKEDEILCNENITNYFILPDYQHFVKVIESYENPSYYEFIRESSFVCFFMDIEIHLERNPEEFANHDIIIQEIIRILRDKFAGAKVITLESHSDTKKSYHVILRNGNDYFTNVKSIKKLVVMWFKDLVSKRIVDTSVYREGLFRTYGSTKAGEDRKLIKSDVSDPFEFIDTFVCYCPNAVSVESETDTSILTEVECEKRQSPKHKSDLSSGDKQCIKHFIRREYNYKETDFRDIFIDKKLNCIVIALDDKFCHNMDREHKSNNQYIVIDTFSCKQKCHDSDCVDYKYKEIKFDKLPREINEIILKCLKVNKHEQELIEKAIEDCINYISKNFDENIQNIQFDKNEMTFKSDASEMNSLAIRGKCVQCRLEHQINTTGYCLKCSVCNMVFPKNQMIPVDDRYKNLNNFWSNYNQLINNGTVIVNNYYNGEQEFSCDVQLDENIIEDKKMLRILNECLDGHKVTKLAELMQMLHKEYIYTGVDWYMFDGSKWILDLKTLNLKRHMLELCGLFNKIKTYYENKTSDNKTVDLIKNIKSLITKLNKPQLKDDIIKEATLFYADTGFVSKLNSKKHLVPFQNGAFNLIDKQYKQTLKEDYVNLTVGYNYDSLVHNPEVQEFIDKVLPKKTVRDYVLKKFSECLNGDIPNTNFLMFVGDGANGKSQLLNLAKLTLGEFGEKVEVTLLTRKRNNANEANSEKIKLLNKRFAFLSEPEDGEKINIGLLKELTGSEEIVARGLYQESVSFVMEAKLFLACNELPEIKGEDAALWRRIRVIDFPSRFVDEPKESNEYKIDRTLPSRMREDVTWRQTFMNILLKYYYQEIKEPVEESLKTNEYRKDNNEFHNWLEENVIYREGGTLKLQDCVELFVGKKVGSRQLGKFRSHVEKFIKDKFPNVKHEYGQFWIGDKTYKGWQNVEINDSIS